MLTGTTVTVLRPSVVGTDRLGNPVPGEPGAEQVGNVLVAPGPTADMEASRPEGVTVAYTLHFPKAYAGSLRGCYVRLPQPWSGTYRVVGDPRPYMDENTPGSWDRPVEVEAADG